MPLGPHPTLGHTDVVPASQTVSTLPTEQSYARDLLQASDRGIALYDADLNLVAYNDVYADLMRQHGVAPEPGRSMAAVMDDLARSDPSQDNGGETPSSDPLTAFQPGSAYTVEHSDAEHGGLSIRRQRMANGTAVEIVIAVAQSAEEERARRLVTSTRRQLTQALDAMGDGLALWNSDDKLVVFNQNYVDLNPHIGDLIRPGMGFEELLRTAFARRGIQAEDQDAEFARFLARHRDPGEPFEILLADGRWVQVRENRTSDGGIIGTRTDVTDLKQRELALARMTEDLHRQTALFDTALNNMIQGLCMFDEAQRLIVCNQRYLDMYGFSADVVKPGITLREVMEYSISLGNYSEADAEAALAARPVLAGEVKRSTINQHLRDGRVIAVMNEPMASGGSIATYQDITELERGREKLVERTAMLERSNRELQDFAYVASHDLQEPLRKIEAFGDRLAKKYGDALEEDGRNYISRMQNAASRMRQLINDLLNYSRIATKARPFVATDLNEVLGGVLGDLQMRIEETQGRVEAGRLPTIDADPMQMRQLLQNLIANALKFRRPDVPPVVTISAEDAREEGFCKLVVADNGIGFEPRYSDQIFTIFQRLHGRAEYEGTGVGLATARKIVERHGGWIDATGVPGEGATFTAHLLVAHTVAEGVQ